MLLTEDGTTAAMEVEDLNTDMNIIGGGYRPYLQIEGKSYRFDEKLTLQPPEGIPYPLSQLRRAFATEDMVIYRGYNAGDHAHLTGEEGEIPLQDIRVVLYNGGNTLEVRTGEGEEQYLYNIANRKTRPFREDDAFSSHSNTDFHVFKKAGGYFEDAYYVLDADFDLVVSPEAGFEAFAMTEDMLVLYDGDPGFEHKGFYRGVPFTVPGRVFYCGGTSCTLRTDRGYGMMNERGELILSTSDRLQINQSGDTYSLEDGIYTLYNETGSVVLRGAYDRVSSLGENRWEVARDGVYSVVDKQGKQIIAPDPKFTYGFSVYRDFGTSLIGGRYDDNFVVFDIDGEQLFHFDVHDDEVFESAGLLIGYSRKTLASLPEKLRKRFNPSDVWIVAHKAGNDGSYELVDVHGQRVLPDRYASIFPLPGGSIYVLETLSGKWGAVRIGPE